MQAARFAVEKIKEGCTPQKDSAIEEYDAAVSSLNTVEVFIRHHHGVEYHREEILPLKG